MFPAFVAALAFGCVLAIGRDAFRRVTPDRVAWMVAFGLFGVAASTEVIGQTSGWTELLVRVYYVCGAVLVVGFLALGQLYLLAGHRISRFAPGAALLLTAVSVSTVWGAPIDSARLDADGWDALTRTPGLIALAISVNTIGTLILLGGLLFSVYRFRTSGTHRNRMLGCLLIALGTTSVALGGTATRLGSDQILYVAMAIGISLIFGGYLLARRPEAVAGAVRLKQAERGPRLVPISNETGTAIAFIEGRLLHMSDADLMAECQIWSVPYREIDGFTRAEARRAWTFRTRLSQHGQAGFDARSVSIRQQLTDLYFDVLSPDTTLLDRPVMTPVDRLPSRDQLLNEPSSRLSGSVD